MADVTLTRTSLTEDGTDITTGLQAMVSADTYYYDNSDGAPIVYFIATDSVTVTIETPFTAVGESLPDKEIAMVNTDVLILKPRVGKYYNQTDKTVKITVSGAGVSVGIYVP